MKWDFILILYNKMNSKLVRVEEGKEFAIIQKEGGVRIMPENVLLPATYETIRQDLLHFKVRPTDVFVIGIPRSGTTWTQEIIWNMTNNSDFNNLLAEQSTFTKSPVLEFPLYPDEERLFLKAYFDALSEDKKPKENCTYWDYLEDLPNPRIFKSHLPPTLINPDLLKMSKVVFIVRDPKDALLSLSYLYKSLSLCSYKGNLEEFADLFMKGNLIYGAMPELVKAWWPYRNHKNVRFVFYEVLRRDTLNEMKKLNEFLGTQLTDEQLIKLEDYCSLKKMKARDQILENKDEGGKFYNEKFDDHGGLLRKGLVGESKEVFSADLHRKLEKYLKEAFEGIDLPYDYLKK